MTHPADSPTDPPPPNPTPNYAGPVVAIFPRPWSFGEIACWAIILVLVTFAAVAAAAQQAAPATKEAVVDMSQLITARMTVGAHALFGGGPGPIAPLLRQIDANAKTPRDQFRAAIVHGELETPEEALARADALAETVPDLVDDTATLHTIYETGEKPPAAEWEQFRDRHQWFADLALATAKPGSPERSSLIIAAIVSLIALEVAVLGLVVATLAGLILLIIASIMLAKGRLTPAFPKALVPPRDFRTYLQGFTWYLAGMLLLGLVLRYVLRLPMLVVAAIELPTAFLLGAFWPRLVGQTWAEWRTAMGLHRGRGVLVEMFSGFLGYLAGLPIMAVGVGITVLLSKFSAATPTHPINEVLQKGPAWIALAFVLASLWAPVTEELMFRGAFFAAMRERFSWWVTAPVVALIFALIHPQGWVAVPVLAAIAIVLAGIREWRGSIIGCITAHALHNGMTLLIVLLLLG